jgi:hypothetical protein
MPRRVRCVDAASRPAPDAEETSRGLRVKAPAIAVGARSICWGLATIQFSIDSYPNSQIEEARFTFNGGRAKYRNPAQSRIIHPASYHAADEPGMGPGCASCEKGRLKCNARLRRQTCRYPVRAAARRRGRLTSIPRSPTRVSEIKLCGLGGACRSDLNP